MILRTVITITVIIVKVISKLRWVSVILRPITVGIEVMKKDEVREMMPKCRATMSRQNSDHYKVC